LGALKKGFLKDVCHSVPTEGAGVYKEYFCHFGFRNPDMRLTPEEAPLSFGIGGPD